MIRPHVIGSKAVPSRQLFPKYIPDLPRFATSCQRPLAARPQHWLTVGEGRPELTAVCNDRRLAGGCHCFDLAIRARMPARLVAESDVSVVAFAARAPVPWAPTCRHRFKRLRNELWLNAMADLKRSWLKLLSQRASKSKWRVMARN